MSSLFPEMADELRRRDLAAQRSLEQRLSGESLDRPPCRQKVMFSGMGCLPGQEDLLPTLAMRDDGRRLLSDARQGDTLIICDIDRLGATTLDLLSVLTWLDDRGVKVFDAVTRQITKLFAECGEVTDDSVRHGSKGKGRWNYWRVFRAFHFYKRAMEEGQVV